MAGRVQCRPVRVAEDDAAATYPRLAGDSAKSGTEAGKVPSGDERLYRQPASSGSVLIKPMARTSIAGSMLMA